MEFLADTDPDFVLLRPELRDLIREAERLGREGIEDGFKTLPGHIRVLLNSMIAELPQFFLRGQLPFYRMLDTLWPLAEKVQREKELAEKAQRKKGICDPTVM